MPLDLLRCQCFKRDLLIRSMWQWKHFKREFPRTWFASYDILYQSNVNYPGPDWPTMTLHLPQTCILHDLIRQQWHFNSVKRAFYRIWYTENDILNHADVDLQYLIRQIWCIIKIHYMWFFQELYRTWYGNINYKTASQT